MRQSFKIMWILLILILAVPCVGSAENPRNKPDRSCVSVSGVVASANDHSFILDYGKGQIIVEMDDWDWYGEGKSLLDGDKVTVYGRIDDDLFETASIEASSVYVENLNTFFYANDADEEDLAFGIYPTPIVVSWLDLTGTVTEVDGREFTLDTGKRKIQIDTINMPYNPMDDQGFQKIRKGDRVKAFGHMDYDLFEKKELMADSVITLAKDKKKKSSS